MSDLKKTLARLSKLTSQTKGSTKYFKCKKGKNNLLFLSSEQTGDPFLEWGIHKNLLEPSWKGLPCTKHNKNEDCLICKVIEDLKKANWKGNFPLWKPIELKVEFYSPIIDLDDIEAGVQWFRYGKSVLTQMQNWLLNLEEDEAMFYDLENPERVIVSYNPDADPALMYSLDKKVLKTLPENLEELMKEIKPLTELFNFDKTEEEIAALLETYMSATEDSLDEEGEAEGEAGDGDGDEEGEEVVEEGEEVEEEAPKKLSRLKKDK